MKEQQQRRSATTIRLEEQDKQAIARIKEMYGCPSDVAAIRLALRMTARLAQSPPPSRPKR